MLKKYIIGIDEVGRGCLAGPVVVCAALTVRGRQFFSKRLGALRDSKKTSPRMREEWFLYLKKAEVLFAVARVSPAVIDRTNISRAANIAAGRALERVLFLAGLREEDTSIFLDGGLFLESKEKSLPRASTIVRGDEKVKVVAAASIIAKVVRDRLMVRLSKKYLGYGFEAHRGYGTKMHFRAIKSFGPSAIHRKTFLKNVKI